MSLYLNWMEDGLQHGENITEEEVPGLRQRVKQLLPCIGHVTHFTQTAKTQWTFKVIHKLRNTFVESYFVPEDDHAFCEQLVL